MLRHLTAWLGLILGAACIAAEQPNVVLVMCDDLGYGDPGSFYPRSPIKTPHIDQMAANGLKFTRFYSAAPVCSPTRGSCLTGRHPYRYGIYSANTGHIKADEITLPELLKKQGYTTGHFGKWHLGTLTKTVQDANRGGPRGAKHFAPPSQHGYDQSFVTESKVPTFDPMIKPQGANRQAWDALKDKSSAQVYGTRYWDHQGNEVTAGLEGDDSRIIMDRALPFMEQAVRDGRPFFAAIWFHAPHLPVVASPQHAASYSEFDVYQRNYYGCVTALDEQVGRLRGQLRQWGIAENTMLWFCSDNGPEGQAGKAPGSAASFRGRKRSLYEGGVRVPGILEWPRHVRPGSTAVPAVTSDYLPTVLDYLEVDYPDQRPLDGISLRGVISGRSTSRGKPIGFQSKNQIAWHVGQHKLYSGDGGKTWQLFDLVADPGESHDIAASLPAQTKQMVGEVKQWQQSCKASDRGEDY
ncbi:MAG: sulfatase-like hydrolase/transferase [Pirellulales bacterium]|nr:sulfatase-like hydrolase/transferase [Pirellulales bacterium]